MDWFRRSNPQVFSVSDVADNATIPEIMVVDK